MDNLGDFDTLKHVLGLAEGHEVFRAGWDAAQAAFAREGAEFLSAESIGGACRYLQFAEPLPDVFAARRAAIAGNPALKRFAWQVYHRLFHFSESKPARWPALPPALGEAADLFYAFVLLAGAPHLRAAHAARGIPDAITRDTLSDLELWMRAYRKQYGDWGFDQMCWLAIHFSGRLVKLGRLQFELRSFDAPFRFFRKVGGPGMLALAEDGMRFRADGQFDGANSVYDVEGAWTSEYTEDTAEVRGYAVSADGYAVRRPLSLPLAEWKPVLTPGDPVLGVHIPAIGPLEPEACAASFAWAEAFFPEHFPEHVFRAFDCNSWLLDSQLAEYLAPESNIVRFQNMFALLPAPEASDAQPVERVFDNRFASIASAPQETSLQRHFVAHMRAGRHWRNALGVRFPENRAGGAARGLAMEAAPGT